MSFDVFLERFENGESADVPREPVLDVLRRASFSPQTGDGFYVVAFSDGTDVEFSALGLESARRFTGCAFHIHAFGGAIAQFIFDIARAGDMVIIPAMESNPLIMVSERQTSHVPSNDPRPVLISTGAELSAILKGA